MLEHLVPIDLMYTVLIVCFFDKHKTAYEMRISDWSSDVCSSDLAGSSAPTTSGPVIDCVEAANASTKAAANTARTVVSQVRLIDRFKIRGQPSREGAI